MDTTRRAHSNTARDLYQYVKVRIWGGHLELRSQPWRWSHTNISTHWPPTGKLCLSERSEPCTDPFPKLSLWVFCHCTPGFCSQPFILFPAGISLHPPCLAASATLSFRPRGCSQARLLYRRITMGCLSNESRSLKYSM